MRTFDLESLEDLLPDTARQIADVIGFPATQALVERFGGASFPIGRGLRGSGEKRLSMLREVIGPEKTQLLVRHFGGDSTLLIPRCADALREWRNRCFYADVDEMVSNGESLRMAMTVLGPKYGFCHTTAWGLLARRHKPAQSSQQASLF